MKDIQLSGVLLMLLNMDVSRDDVEHSSLHIRLTIASAAPFRVRALIHIIN
ncbi:hypothetical protein SAMN02910417_02113 [Eubacterium oxidoreducens]|uniref:Uncharacterized protein n=1 Tax=Eubacterium oxidoreducens TaxID=1732 RepID=A0A1G6C599_EUBOX|nr:hypothetical protein SAMN02910417_02113 [Eubacterium oxidoreducens]